MLLILLVLFTYLIVGDLFMHALDVCLLLTYSFIHDVFMHVVDVCLPKIMVKKTGKRNKNRGLLSPHALTFLHDKTAIIK